MPTEHFQSEEAYRKYRAYTHIHGIKTHAKTVCVKGSGCHNVNHSGKQSRKSSGKKTVSK